MPAQGVRVPFSKRPCLGAGRKTKLLASKMCLHDTSRAKLSQAPDACNTWSHSQCYLIALKGALGELGAQDACPHRGGAACHSFLYCLQEVLGKPTCFQARTRRGLLSPWILLCLLATHTHKVGRHDVIQIKALP